MLDKMSHDQGYLRFFAYMSFVNASMVRLVTSSNLIRIYIFWELEMRGYIKKCQQKLSCFFFY